MTSATPDLYIPIGYDVSDGLDGSPLRHLMSPSGYHMTVIGPDPEREAFREQFVRTVRETGECDIVEVGEGMVSVDVLLNEMYRRQTASDLLHAHGKRAQFSRLLVIIHTTASAAARSRAKVLIEQSRWTGITVYIEFGSYHESGLPSAMMNSWTTVFLGEESELWVRSRYNSVPLAQTNQYVVTEATKSVVSAVLV